MSMPVGYVVGTWAISSSKLLTQGVGTASLAARGAGSRGGDEALEYVEPLLL